LTGIKTKVSAATQGVGKTIIPVPAGNQLSACNHADHPPFRAKRSEQTIKGLLPCKSFFDEFYRAKKSKGLGNLIIQTARGKNLKKPRVYRAPLWS
jgi:hypothetical protein